MKNVKKLFAISMVALLTLSAVGCGEKKSDGKVTITISGTPNETQTEKLKLHDEKVVAFEEKYPNIKIISDSNSYSDAKVFMVTAAAKQLPTLYNSHFTDTKLRIREGYAADITDYLKDNDILNKINPEILSVVADEKGNIYGIPKEGYAMGLVLNKELFKKAGLVNEDGSIKYPDTYTQLAEYSQIIKEKTGVAGYAIPTTNNCGGWHFMNIAWSNGVKFMKQNEDGSWKATFNTPEAVKSLQFVKDLKWKYNALPNNAVIDQNELYKLYGTSQAAMIFSPPSDTWSQKFGMKLADIAMAKMPKGDKERYSQTGGTAVMFAPNATEEEIDATMKWLDFNGNLVTFSETQIAQSDNSWRIKKQENALIIPKAPFSIWIDSERNEITDGIRAKYANVDIKDFDDYIDLSNVTLKTEEPVCAQELYAVLDKAIQEVINNKDADCKALIERANNDFQKNHLDKLD